MLRAGSNNTEQSIELSKLAIDAGADSLLIVTPPYNKPNPSGLFAHYEEISKNCSQVDLCLYHVPGRTAQLLDIDTMKKITELPNVSMLKEASADMSLFSNCVKQCSAHILSGDDPTSWQV